MTLVCAQSHVNVRLDDGSVRRISDLQGSIRDRHRLNDKPGRPIVRIHDPIRRPSSVCSASAILALSSSSEATSGPGPDSCGGSTDLALSAAFLVRALDAGQQ